ncbi:MAG TPA: peptidylprolyl isomerase [Alphaproteobacteria bacterium]|nr:peptidylprolyl isomerase [Alphaproteobacteria bacterium]
MRALIYVIVLLFQLVAAMPAHAAPAAFGDSIVAVVSTTVISGRELQQRVALTSRQLGGDKSLSEADKKYIENKSLVILIDEELQRQFAAANGITVTPEDLKRYRAAVGEQVDLTKLGKGLEDPLKRKMEAEIRWQKIIAEIVRPRINISQAEIDQLIAGMLKGRHVVERDISQILLAVNDKAEEEKKHQKIIEIADKLKNGAKFEDMAKQFSEDDSAKNGGKMGWFASGELNPQLEEALDKLEPGQVSGIIRTPLGWHLIRIDNSRTTKPLEDNEANMAQYRTRVREHLTANRVELEARRLMREIRQRSFVDIRKAS